MIIIEMHDHEGNLAPLMLSELIKKSVDALARYGDMLVWLETSCHGYDDQERHSLPVTEIEVLPINKAKEHSYWHDEKYKDTFIITSRQ